MSRRIVMTRPVVCSVWWPCLTLVMVVHVVCGSRDVPPAPGLAASPAHTATEDAVHSARPCGDGLCLCQGITANCSDHQENFTYVPSLPDGIHHVELSHNGLSSDNLTGGFFANLTRITSLDLSYNLITWLSKEAFDGMGGLEWLDLNGNDELQLDSLRQIFSIPTLTDVNLENCNLPPPPTYVFQSEQYNIEHIMFSSNPHGGTYNLDGFCPLQNLQDLELRQCDLNSITSSCPLPSLYHLDLADNSLRSFPKTCSGKESIFPVLSYLVLRQNRIQILSTAEVCLPSLARLDISFNFIKLYPARTFSAVKFPLLKELLLNDQFNARVVFSEKSRIEDNAFDNNNLMEIDLRNNGLSFASREKVGKFAFANCSGVKYLHLDSNNSSYMDDHRFSELVGHLHSLVVLSLSNNMIGAIPARTFVNFPYLSNLFLANNMIADVPDGAFDILFGLNSLDLHNNKIKTINEHTFSKHLRKTLARLRLEFNPLVCSCDLRWFTHWFLTERFDVFEDSNTTTKYVCGNLPGVALANFSMADQACLLSQEVNLLLIQSCGIFILLLTLASLVFRYRWHIRLLMYEAFRGRDVLRRQRLLTNNFDFDVFVSYASEDLPWVRHQLMAKLEGELGLRLCVHERDFVPGRHIVDNIVQCVESSKKVLMVYSTPFVQSQWCQFELSLCLSHVLDYDDALIVVCVDDVTSRGMSSSMMAVLKTTTYIQWREGQEEAIASFWGRLLQGLHEILPR
ncbi:toll-like receptor 2 [Babylonia areolata]|uniref:toll-like receptor 2 n=1 Tax=Babylonia areolata TaxID=304850 RepID=UPI003FD6A617